MKLLEQYIGENIYELILGQDFLGMTPNDSS